MRRRDEVGSSQPSQPPSSDFAIFSDAVGGKKKGRISGFGSLASMIGDTRSVFQPSSSGSASSSRTEPSPATESRITQLEVELAQI